MWGQGHTKFVVGQQDANLLNTMGVRAAISSPGLSEVAAGRLLLWHKRGGTSLGIPPGERLLRTVEPPYPLTEVSEPGDVVGWWGGCHFCPGQ